LLTDVSPDGGLKAILKQVDLELVALNSVRRPASIERTGVWMETRCPRCQAANPPQATWCNQCGATFVPAAVGQPAQQQAGWGPPPAPSLPPSSAPSWGQPGYAPPAQEPPQSDLASVWLRIGARLVDVILVGFLAGFTLGFLSAFVPIPEGAAFNLVLLMTVALYETLLLASWGRTLGKMLFGLRVVRIDRTPLGLRDALVRSAIIDALGVIPLGWAIAAIVLERDRLRQGWHDKAAGTVVVTTGRRF
jgi:uncharacterized RDD family membrane protein YckC